MNEIKINLGCGWRNFGKDWVHIDGGDYSHLDSHDIVTLPYRDNTVDLIYASHVLEYFDYDAAVILMYGWYRKLKPGGTIRIAVPNFAAMASLYMAGQYPLESFLGPLYGKMYMDGKAIYHKTAYDYARLKSVLFKAGFNYVRMYDWKDTEHSMYDDHSQAYLPHMDKENGTLISLNMEAIK